MNKPPPSVLQTPGFAHYSLAWSPFHTSRIALASSANYGLVGNGRLHLVSLAPGAGGVPALNVDKYYETQDGLYDVAWSEIHENQLVTASGDGSIRLWDVMLNDLPIRAWQEHTREVFSVDWSNLQKDLFVSSSWDGTVKLWSPERPRSISTLHAHHSCVYQALFSPHQPGVIATCSTDGTMRLFDMRTPAYLPSGPPNSNFNTPLSAPVLTVPVSTTEVLSLDWNKYRPYVLATAGVDKGVKVWDCRMVKTGPEAGQEAVGGICELGLAGHEYAVRKVQWSPHRADVLASASYDMTCRIWSTTPAPGRTHLLHIHDPHSEFVVGCAWSLYDEGVIGSCFPPELHGKNVVYELETMSSNLRDDSDPEDILSSSLGTLYDYAAITYSSAGSVFTYTVPGDIVSKLGRHLTHGESPSADLTITLTTPDTKAANWHLHASSIWVSSLYLAGHLDELGLAAHNQPLSILELGASAGLPGILIAKLYENIRVTVSDYPDDELIRTLAANVARNEVEKRCTAVPYGWGSDPSVLLQDVPDGYDVIIAADTLWNPELHSVFIQSLALTLRKRDDARVHLVAGLHTGRYTIEAFLKAVQAFGLEIESAVEREVEGGHARPWSVDWAEGEDDGERRRWVVWMVLKWARQEGP
ncbi:WD40 repeat-like protein [Heliocybe sulcata]|uniref:Peroxin-7 n=1 Tax=Heliocybe sulcata TaxID=5364 RepID=A0A5C3MUP8_9AGAM|nr:WD40 repeat-like protein [Heliocybe sulcata]